MKKYLISVIVLVLLMSVSCDSGNGPATPEPPSREWLMEQVDVFLVESGNPTPVHPGTDMKPDVARSYLAYILTDWDNDPMACTRYDRLLQAMNADSTVSEVIYRLERAKAPHWDVPKHWEPILIPCP